MLLTLSDDSGRLDDAISAYGDGLSFDNSESRSTAQHEQSVLIRAKHKLETVREMIRQKKYSSALPHISAIIQEIGSSFNEVNMLKVHILLGLRKFEEVCNVTNAMLKTATNGNDIELLLVRARCLYAMGDLDNSLKHLQQIMKRDPENSDGRTLLRSVRAMLEKKEEGNKSFGIGSWQSAIDAWTQCLALDPKNCAFNCKLYANRAVAWMKLSNYAQAIRDCDEALEVDPGFVKVILRRAECRMSLGGKENIELAIR